MHSPANAEAVYAIERPHPDLWKYYLLTMLVFPPALPFMILPMWFRYSTMRYSFTKEGVSMRWGVLFRRETILQYSRIQDIHIRSNIVERWLGLGRVLVQTASGNSSAEMTLEGIKEFELVRDFLYTRMRGVVDAEAPIARAEEPAGAGSVPDPELAGVLREIAAELRQIRSAVEQQRHPGAGGGHV